MNAYLIDGYNLLHAMGILHGQSGPRVLEKARGALIGFLHGAFVGTLSQARATVVFDASHPPPGSSSELLQKGIKVLFAVHEPEADDLIEDLVRQESSPKNLAVVSNDHRIQKFAGRHHCRVLDCLDFLEELNKARKIVKDLGIAPEKPENPSTAEWEKWLKEFSSLEDDPEFKDFFKPFDFER